MKYKLSKDQWRALVCVLEDRGFEADWPGVWDIMKSGITARIPPSGNNISIAHYSGYCYLRENIDSDAAFDAILAFIEKIEFRMPATAALRVLSGETNPKYFMQATDDGFEFVLSSDQWPETARSVPLAYTWRTASKKLDLKIRGKSKFVVAKGGKFGYRKNEKSEFYIVKPEDGKEYRVSKTTYQEAEESSKPLKGRPPKLAKQVKETPVKAKPKAKSKAKPKLATAPKAKDEKTATIDLLNDQFGKGWTARKIKAELQTTIELKTWPTKKTDLFAQIVKEYGDEIIDILHSRNANKAWLDKMTEQERKAIVEITDFTPSVIIQALQRSNIELPAGSTTDPAFKFKMAQLLVEEFGIDKAGEIVNEVGKDRNRLQKERNERIAHQNSRNEKMRKRGDPMPPQARVITFRGAKAPSQYSPSDKDDQLTSALKIVLLELWRFAGQQLRPTVHLTVKPFREGHAVSEYLQVDTSPNELTDYSADQFFEAFTKHYKEKQSNEIWIEKTSRSKKGKLEDEAEIIIRLQEMPGVKVKLKVRINPKRLDSLYTKNNLFLTQASLQDRIRYIASVKNTKAQLWNLTVSVERLKPREFKLA